MSGWYDRCVPDFLRKCWTILQSSCAVFPPTSRMWEFQFLHILILTCTLSSVLFLCGFNLHFLHRGWSWTSFPCDYLPSVYLLWWDVFLNCFILNFWTQGLVHAGQALCYWPMSPASLYWILRVLDIQAIFSNTWVRNIFLPVVLCLSSVSFHFNGVGFNSSFFIW
jgi:hypothetical protein